MIYIGSPVLAIVSSNLDVCQRQLCVLLLQSEQGRGLQLPATTPAYVSVVTQPAEDVLHLQIVQLDACSCSGHTQASHVFVIAC
jgi:hypothetical protein